MAEGGVPEVLRGGHRLAKSDHPAAEPFASLDPYLFEATVAGTAGALDVHLTGVLVEQGEDGHLRL